MRYRRLDENGDMTFGNNKFDFVKDLEAVSQAIKTRLKLLKGEWWEDTEEGLPLFQEILASRNIEKVKRLIVERIQKTQGVLSVDNLILTFENRILNITASVSTIYGETLIVFTGE
ncbi:hypothetical protein IJJ97_03645 [bacterium]|nr:hypothetical protein [bacterium]